MPVGIMINSLSIVLGGVLGALLGGRISGGFKENMNMIFGVCSMAMGIHSVILMQNMPAVVFAVILGTMLGMAIHLGEGINAAAGGMQRAISKVLPAKSDLPQAEFTATLVTVVVLFCASGTGIYGSFVSGMTGDHSILIAKSILDLFTALIFACSLGPVVAVVALPQLVIFLALFFCSGLILPLTTPAMIDDFKACGGIVMIATGFRILKLKQFPTADMIPSMVLVMPICLVWVTFVTPLVASLG